MSDDIQLPPLPSSLEGTVLMLLIRDYAEQAVLADRERQAKKAQPAKPQVHEARLSLADNGDWNGGGNPRPGRINILIRWTADGRVWINSERNRDLARILRERFGATEAHAAADALDGGER